MVEHLPHIWGLTVVEMVVRATKHVLKGVLREILDQDGGAIAHFFNCLVGSGSANSVVEESTGSTEKSQSKSTSGKTSSTQSALSEIKPSYLCITPDLVWSHIEESVKFEYLILQIPTLCLCFWMPVHMEKILSFALSN